MTTTTSVAKNIITKSLSKMNTTQTLTKLNQMRLYGMENALRTVLETKADYKGEELAAYLAESEWNDRESRKMNRYLHQAGFRYAASVEEVDFLHPRGLDQRRFTELADCSYLKQREDILLTGLTGTGKSFLASALGHQACTRGWRVRYFSTGKLFEKLQMTRATGAHHKLLRSLERTDLLILDDFGLWPLAAEPAEPTGPVGDHRRPPWPPFDPDRNPDPGQRMARPDRRENHRRRDP
jgi:DNA replication protein DnaC